MSRFLDTFLREPSNRGHLRLAAFGKHPGWDDHIEDMGLDTPSLVQAKQLLYIQGIGDQIDTGAWAKLPADQKLPQFLHLFVWQRAGHFLIGRLWSSSDGKGRSQYPMVVCAQVQGVPLDKALQDLLPALERVQQQCAATRSAQDAQNIVRQTSALLIDKWAAPSATSAPIEAKMKLDFGRCFNRPEGGTHREAFLRVLHQFQEQLAVYQSAQRLGIDKNSGIKPQQIRVPIVADSAPEAILFWEQFVYVQIPPDVPVLIVLPVQGSWLDITLGEPTTQEFHSLLANPKAIPLASSIPYHLKPEIQEKGEQIMADMRQRKQPWIPATNHPDGLSRNSLSSVLAAHARKVMQFVSGRKE